MDSVKDTTYYDNLNVLPSATKEEIKKAYKKATKKIHPDNFVNKSDAEKKIAEKNFSDLTKVYKILIDDNLREKYDKYGTEEYQFPHDNINYDIFNMHVENLRRSNFTNNKPQIEMLDNNVSIKVNLKEIYLEKLMIINTEVYNLKKNCNPTKNQMKCKKCNGTGYINIIHRQMNVIQQIRQECNVCSGKRFLFSNDYFSLEKKVIEFKIPKGILNGEKIILENNGNEIPSWCKDSNNTRSRLILTICDSGKSKIDNIEYYRKYDKFPYNLYIEMEIDIHEWICGTVKTITFLNEKKINIKIPSICEGTNDHLIIPNLGMPTKSLKNKHIYGVLHIHIKIKKSKITNENKEKIWYIFSKNSMKKALSNILLNGNDTYDSVSFDQKDIDDDDDDDENYEETIRNSTFDQNSCNTS